MGHRPESQSKKFGSNLMALANVTRRNKNGYRVTVKPDSKGYIKLQNGDYVEILDTVNCDSELAGFADNRITISSAPSGKPISVSAIKNIVTINGVSYLDIKCKDKQSVLTYGMLEDMIHHFGIDDTKIESIKIIGGKQAAPTIQKCRLLGYTILEYKHYAEISKELNVSSIRVAVSPREIVVASNTFIRTNHTEINCIATISSKAVISICGVRIKEKEKCLKLRGNIQLTGTVKTNNVRQILFIDNTVNNFSLDNLELYGADSIQFEKCNFESLKMDKSLSKYDFSLAIKDCHIDTLNIGGNKEKFNAKSYVITSNISRIL